MTGGALSLLIPQGTVVQMQKLTYLSSRSCHRYKPEHPMWPVWKGNARRMVRSLADRGTTSMGYHISADDFKAIDDAFEAVAKLMADTDVAAG